MKLNLVFTAIASFLLLTTLNASNTGFTVDSTLNMVDGLAAPFNQALPGDTILFEPGQHEFLLIRNFTGAPGKPFIFMNKNGLVTIDTDHYYGISIQNCRYLRFTGTGDETEFYGFRISRVANGAGIGVGDLSSDFEIDHISIENTLVGGIYAKTDPDCSLTTTRDKFTQFNTIIHDNYLAYTGDEGLYIGSSKYLGQEVKCNGKDTILMPSVLNGVRVYNNIIKYTGWDGMMVSSATSDCQIFDNLIMYDSQKEEYGQMSGILIGGGSKCDCFNNYICFGKGCGIESHGLGGYRIFNNIIVEAGRSFAPLDPDEMKYGIYVTDISVQTDSSFSIMHNDIISPKSDGIRFQSIKSKNNLISSNVIINPGNFDYYENGNTSFKGIDSYIMIPDDTADVSEKNNYLARNADVAGFSDNFALLPDSPLIDSAYAQPVGITFDYYHHSRPYGNAPDIGAFEYNPAYLSIPENRENLLPKPVLFPNPVKTEISINYLCEKQGTVVLGIYNLQGERVLRKEQLSLPEEVQEITVNVEQLPAGIYIYQLSSFKQISTGRFIKIN